MLNRIFLIGNLRRNPEMVYTPSGKALTKFSLAVNRPARFSKEGGERQEETDWFNIVAWERLAETCNNFLHKGSKVFIEGRLESHKYTDKSGVERIGWDVIATEMRMLDPKQTQPGSAHTGASEGGYPDGGDALPEEIPF
jgi:single-strand DNA-binding protein